ncbi:hypothetical protein M9H77_13837 [Catharanthus roseus]|uniref:Uncharacterized protein n=1 Tax=Catharanthus roseus TaxID=4058 RepID=A0ACC0BLG7_CATRO|nr:hypothetical protein M9H77_13837 [Catharanthus roseus]
MAFERRGDSSKDSFESIDSCDDKGCQNNTQNLEPQELKEANKAQANENGKYVIVKERYLNFNVILIHENPVFTYGLDSYEVNEQSKGDDVTKGWKVETRQRPNGIKDNLYYHDSSKQLRSLDEQAYRLVKLPRNCDSELEQKRAKMFHIMQEETQKNKWIVENFLAKSYKNLISGSYGCEINEDIHKTVNEFLEISLESPGN